MAKYIATDKHRFLRSIAGDILVSVGEVISRGSHRLIGYYDSPLLAVAIDVHRIPPRLFEVEGDAMYHDGVNGFVRQLTVLREVEVPEISAIALARWTIEIALWQLGAAAEDGQREWNGYGAWQQWATQWLACTNRAAIEAYEPYMSEEVPELVELSATAAHHACTDYDIEFYAAQTACLAAGHAEEDVDFDGPAFARHLDALLQQAISDEESLTRCR